MTISPDGDIQSHTHEEDEWKTTSSGLSTSFMDAFNQKKKVAVQQAQKKIKISSPASSATTQTPSDMRTHMY